MSLDKARERDKGIPQHFTSNSAKHYKEYKEKESTFIKIKVWYIFSCLCYKTSTEDGGRMIAM